jgi:hypothetical protein
MINWQDDLHERLKALREPADQSDMIRRHIKECLHRAYNTERVYNPWTRYPREEKETTGCRVDEDIKLIENK